MTNPICVVESLSELSELADDREMPTHVSGQHRRKHDLTEGYDQMIVSMINACGRLVLTSDALLGIKEPAETMQLKHPSQCSTMKVLEDGLVVVYLCSRSASINLYM